MKNYLKIIFVIILPFQITCQLANYPNRWFYAASNLQNNQQAEYINRLIKIAADHNLNGMVLSAGLDRLDLQRPDYFERLAAIRDTCLKYDIEIVPKVFSVGYGSSVLAHDPNLTAGLPVKDIPFIVRNRIAELIPDPDLQAEYNDFEKFQDNKADYIFYHEQPGDISFQDKNIFISGMSSIRFQNFDLNQHGHGRLIHEINVTPFRSYKITLFVKTLDLKPAGCFQILIHSQQGHQFRTHRPQLQPTSDWEKIEIGFNSLKYEKIKFYAGVWGAQSGKFWLDDLKIEQLELVNLLRRPGTPVSVTSENSGTVYEEDRDYIVVHRENFDFSSNDNKSSIQIPPGSKIQNGKKILISYYQGLANRENQVTVCMSEPKLYDIWRNQAKMLKEQLNPKKIFLSMDEIRAGGSCKACRDRNITMAQILGDCITRQVEIFRSIMPEIEIYIWSDMLDPNHNAHDNYYLTEGDFNNVWKYIPKDLVIVCWHYSNRMKSIRHFSMLGFPVMAGAYYDGETLENPIGWMNALKLSNDVKGIIYTTWQNKYELLAPFGDLVSPPKK